MENIKELWMQYYPVILSIGGAVVTFGAAALVIWTQISPIITKITDLKKKISDKNDDDNVLKSIQMDTMKTDLLAKINNPTTSDALRAQYQTQLDRLNHYTSFGEDSLSKIEDTVNKYT